MAATYEETFQGIVKSIRKILSDPDIEITGDTTVAELNLDSLDLAELLMELESCFDVGYLETSDVLAKRKERKACFSEATSFTMSQMTDCVLKRRLEREVRV